MNDITRAASRPAFAMPADQTRPGDLIQTIGQHPPVVLTVVDGTFCDLDSHGHPTDPGPTPTHVILGGEKDDELRLRCDEAVWLLSRTYRLTIGWTIHAHRKDGSLIDTSYMPFSDPWRPGQPQHEVTILVEVPGGLAEDTLVEAVFRATNDPDQPRADDDLASAILTAIQATGYTGREAHWSLSVGDTVTVDDRRVWSCRKFGWVLEVSA